MNRKLLSVEWNFKPLRPIKYIPKVDFCKNFNLSQDTLAYALRQNNECSRTSECVDTNYYIEFFETKNEIIKYCHDIYFAITYGFNISNRTLVNYLVDTTTKSMGYWNSFIYDDMFRRDTKVIVDVRLANAFIIFLRQSSRFLYNLMQTHDIVNDY